VNAKSALKLGRCAEWRCWRRLAKNSGRGVAPLKIKSAWWATAWQRRDRFKFMVARLLGLAELPEPADARCSSHRNLPYSHRADWPCRAAAGSCALRAPVGILLVLFVAAVVPTRPRPGWLPQPKAVLGDDFFLSRRLSIALERLSCIGMGAGISGRMRQAAATDSEEFGRPQSGSRCAGER